MGTVPSDGPAWNRSDGCLTGRSFGVLNLDLNETIRRLRLKKQLVENAIAAMEELMNVGSGDPTHIPKRPGRKSMSPEERHKVSERMKKYWANRQRKSE